MRVPSIVSTAIGGASPIFAGAKSVAGFQSPTGVAASEASSSARPSSVAAASGFTQRPLRRSNCWSGKPFSDTAMCVAVSGSSGVSVCSRASASSACHCQPTAASSSSAVPMTTSRKATSAPPPAPGDAGAEAEQQDGKGDQEAEDQRIEPVLRERNDPVRCAARRQVDQDVVTEQPVDDALAEGAIAAVADIGVGKEVAVADDHGALFALRRARR